MKKLIQRFLGRKDSLLPQATSVNNILPKQVMQKIYSEKEWGGKKYDFYSGFGSHSKKVVKPYVRGVKKFLNSNGSKLTVCDLGCGDFNVGHQLIDCAEKYLAFDVVEELIERNKRKFKNKKLIFGCIDIVEDELPKADCVLIRQVLQHMSNDNIKKVVPKLNAFKYAIITEHLPKKEFVPNLDKVTGASIRLSRNSGVVLHEAPFMLESKNRQEMLRIKYNKGVIVTTLYQF